MTGGRRSPSVAPPLRLSASSKDISPALALGLSQMASRNVRVDSLFLDEGFGTLDDEALETALSTLGGLHQEGKLIGVISMSRLSRNASGRRSRSPPGPGRAAA
jgi:exonuclease SbcC